MKFKYKNITISGGVAVGKGTLLNNLRPYLKPYHWKFRSSGQIVRDYLKEYVKPLAKMAPDRLHQAIDNKVRYLLEHDRHWVIEAWLSGFLARDLKETLKVLLICSDEAVRIDRVVNRDKVSVEEAKKIIKERTKEHLSTFRRLYHVDDLFDPKHYHLVIDTYSSGQIETVGKVLDKLGYDHDKIAINKK